MRHALLLLIVFVLLYVTWRLGSAPQHHRWLERLKRHAPWLLLGLMVVLGGLVLAYHLPSLSLL
jgi:hypothetical protein